MTRQLCVIGVATHTWHPEATGNGSDNDGAPEPLTMWQHVVREAIRDAHATTQQQLLNHVDALEVVYCQTTQYDDAPRRLADALGISPQRTNYSGVGGTTPQQLVNATARRMLAGEVEVAVIVSGEALHTQQNAKRAGKRLTYAHRPSDKRPFPWEAPFHPDEVAHEVFQAWLTFALFDNARRAKLGAGLEEYRRGTGDLMSQFCNVAVNNPDAWYRTPRSGEDIATVRADNRLVGYPYTKYMISVMDVDMAAALVVATDDAADSLGVPKERRVYLEGWGYATDPVYVAQHADLTSSPAMRAAATAALNAAGTGIDDVEYLDIYSCFPSSVHFALDALELGVDDRRNFTLTGGLPYHGGAASGYMTHSIAAMTRSVRDSNSTGLLTGVGMHMTKHVAAVYRSRPNHSCPPDDVEIQAAVERAYPPRRIADIGELAASDPVTATLTAYSVVHGRDGVATHGVAVCDLDKSTRTYGWIDDPDLHEELESIELIGTEVALTAQRVDTKMGPSTKNILRRR